MSGKINKKSDNFFSFDSFVFNKRTKTKESKEQQKNAKDAFNLVPKISVYNGKIQKF